MPRAILELLRIRTNATRGITAPIPMVQRPMKKAFRTRLMMPNRRQTTKTRIAWILLVLAAKCGMKEIAIKGSCQTKATGHAEDLPGGIGGFIACEIHNCGGDQTAEGRSENNRCAGDQHIEGEALCDLILRKPGCQQRQKGVFQGRQNVDQRNGSHLKRSCDRMRERDFCKKSLRRIWSLQRRSDWT